MVLRPEVDTQVTISKLVDYIINTNQSRYIYVHMYMYIHHPLVPVYSTNLVTTAQTPFVSSAHQR